MKRENYLSPDIKLAEANDGAVPVLSFAPSSNGSLNAEYFNIPISGDHICLVHSAQCLIFAAYYDAAHKLIFVLDETPDDRTPNTLLVINPDHGDPDRKWDDILARDFDANLETIRPKKDNKYQKLDIEYEGLDIYNRLINAYQSGESIESALHELSGFRNRAAVRLANLRLTAAGEQIRTATDTIATTETSIDNLHVQIQAQKEKLSRLKSRVGKEPTKESAGKILRASAKVDAAKEKLKRAEVRLRRAHARLEDANADAEAARAQLLALNNEPKVENMPEEVKPLFTRDPEIMDDSAAFRPIEFGAQNPPAYAVPPSPESQFVPPTLAPPPPPPPPPPAGGHSGVLPSETANMYAPAAAQQPTAHYPAAPVPPVPHTPTPTYAVPPPHRPLGGSEIPVMSADRQRPGALYYLMLTILIALSVLTLWLYQNNMGDTLPNIINTSENARPTATARIFSRTAARQQPAEEHQVPTPERPVVAPTFDSDFDLDSPFLDSTFESPPAPMDESPLEFAEVIYHELSETFHEPATDNIWGNAPPPMPVTPEVFEVEPHEILYPGNYVATPFEITMEQQFDTEGPDQACEGGALPDRHGCCEGEMFNPDVTSPDSPFGSCCPIGDPYNCFPPLP